MSGHIFITGDCHGDYDISKLTSKKWPQGKSLDKDDYLIVAGDFGLIWSNNENDEFEKYLINWYTNEKKWTTLFVDGNHENHRRLNELETTRMFDGVVGVVNDSIYHLKRGGVYTIHGSKFFTMGGASSHDREIRIIDVDWWEAEQPNYQECSYGIENLNKHNWKVDYVVTHTMPNTKMSLFGFDQKYKGLKECSISKYLNIIVENLDFKKWYFGHFHADVDRENFRLIYNDVIQIQ